MPGYVYLLHFSRPYKQASHYLGSTNDLEGRLKRHAAGNGARLVEVVMAAGISYELARVWEHDTESEARQHEHSLKKNGHNPRFCPICKQRKQEEGNHGTKD